MIFEKIFPVKNLVKWNEQLVYLAINATVHNKRANTTSSKTYSLVKYTI